MIPPRGIVVSVNRGKKLAAYGLVLVAAFGIGAVAGATVGPDRDDEPTTTISETDAEHAGHDG
jgi:hypothetical protein